LSREIIAERIYAFSSTFKVACPFVDFVRSAINIYPAQSRIDMTVPVGWARGSAVSRHYKHLAVRGRSTNIN